jgi:hypothetical protein
VGSPEFSLDDGEKKIVSQALHLNVGTEARGKVDKSSSARMKKGKA